MQEMLVLGNAGLYECVVAPALVSFSRAFQKNMEKTDTTLLMRVSHKFYKVSIKRLDMPVIIFF